MTDDRLKQIEEFWNKNLCGKHFIDTKYPSKEFFEQYIAFRYSKEHHLDYFIDWESAKNKDILEIGIGIGSDGTRWARYAKSYTGIDLTDEAVEATRIHFKHLGLKGKIIKANTEVLPFSDNEFDIVYSHGVLHHTPDIRKALKEIYRVMKPQGEFILMLYSKDSLNYWLRIQFYFRLRFLFELLKNKLGLKANEHWKSHIRNYQIKGHSYFSWNGWYHHCTDGPDCEIANIYHKYEIISLLKGAGFIVKKIVKAHFPIKVSPKLERFLSRYIGFYQFVWAYKI
jgi:ubiquinone/menaquinone biosynthesis C-methylase UbiE